ncbi:MAG: NADH dehydrogenase (quinone) subunit D [Thermoguttaceae bacterium]|jgi:NADH-quinone oxidoreductase subunit D
MPLERSPLADTTPQAPQPYLWTLNFGPQHPATHTTLRLVLRLEGERVVDAVPDIGYLHSGFEKLGESLDYNQYVTVTDRMNYVSPMSNNVGWHLAVEKLMGIEVPPRCRYLRVLACELMRLSDHLLCLGAMGLDTGAFTHFMYAFNAREKIYDICEALCGARFTNSYTRVGGLMADISPLGISLIREFLDEAPRALEDMERLLLHNRIFIDRMQGVGVLSRAEAINRAASGPIARASGVERDLRRDEPYLSYADFDFQVCCAREGDCLARYRVRMAEMWESLKIVRQAIDNLPAGPIQVGQEARTVVPPPGAVWNTIEGLIAHFELVMTNRGFSVPCEEVYMATEAPNGELGFYIVGDGSPRAYRARCRGPSFLHFAMFPHLIRGHTLSDVVAILGSLNIIAAELDR